MKSLDINAIARQSGVSIATVSRVLNNEHGVSEEVRRKTLQIIESQGYRPRANVRRATRLGMVLQEESPQIDGFLSAVLSGIFRYASEENIETTLIHYNPNLHGGPSLVEYLRRKRCNGAVILTPGSEDPAEFSAARIPAVFVANRREADGVGFIDCDGFAGALEQTRYLIRLGHRKIGFLSGELERFIDHQERIAAYRQAMKEAGAPVKEGWVVPYRPGLTEQMGYEHTQRLLTEHPDITAIFANNDPLAWGAICAAVEMGRRIPEDLSIVGYDDLPASRFCNPPLTTLRQPLHQMGYTAAQSVDHKLRGKLDQLPRQVLPGELIVRRSCAPPLNDKPPFTLPPRGICD